MESVTFFSPEKFRLSYGPDFEPIILELLGMSQDEGEILMLLDQDRK